MTKEEVSAQVSLAKTGSQKAFSILYKLLYNQIYNHVASLVKNRELAEDLTSEAFTKAFTRINKFQNDISFIMWLKTIAVNTVIDNVRRKHMNVLNYPVDDDEFQSVIEDEYAQSPEDALIKTETRLEVEKNIDSLSNRARQVISHRYIDGLTYREIAEKLGISIGTVKSYISKATNKIKPKN